MSSFIPYNTKDTDAIDNNFIYSVEPNRGFDTHNKILISINDINNPSTCFKTVEIDLPYRRPFSTYGNSIKVGTDTFTYSDEPPFLIGENKPINPKTIRQYEINTTVSPTNINSIVSHTTLLYNQTVFEIIKTVKGSESWIAIGNIILNTIFKDGETFLTVTYISTIHFGLNKYFQVSSQRHYNKNNTFSVFDQNKLKSSELLRSFADLDLDYSLLTTAVYKVNPNDYSLTLVNVMYHSNNDVDLFQSNVIPKYQPVMDDHTLSLKIIPQTSGLDTNYKLCFGDVDSLYGYYHEIDHTKTTDFYYWNYIPANIKYSTFKYMDNLYVIYNDDISHRISFDILTSNWDYCDTVPPITTDILAYDTSDIVHSISSAVINNSVFIAVTYYNITKNQFKIKIYNVDLTSILNGDILNINWAEFLSSVYEISDARTGTLGTNGSILKFVYINTTDDNVFLMKLNNDIFISDVYITSTGANKNYYSNSTMYNAMSYVPSTTIVSSVIKQINPDDYQIIDMSIPISTHGYTNKDMNTMSNNIYNFQFNFISDTEWYLNQFVSYNIYKYVNNEYNAAYYSKLQKFKNGYRTYIGLINSDGSQNIKDSQHIVFDNNQMVIWDYNGDYPNINDSNITRVNVDNIIKEFTYVKPKIYIKPTSNSRVGYSINHTLTNSETQFIELGTSISKISTNNYSYGNINILPYTTGKEWVAGGVSGIFNTVVSFIRKEDLQKTPQLKTTLNLHTSECNVEQFERPIINFDTLIDRINTKKGLVNSNAELVLIPANLPPSIPISKIRAQVTHPDKTAKMGFDGTSKFIKSLYGRAIQHFPTAPFKYNLVINNYGVDQSYTYDYTVWTLDNIYLYPTNVAITANDRGTKLDGSILPDVGLIESTYKDRKNINITKNVKLVDSYLDRADITVKFNPTKPTTNIYNDNFYSTLSGTTEIITYRYRYFCFAVKRDVTDNVVNTSNPYYKYRDPINYLKLTNPTTRISDFKLQYNFGSFALPIPSLIDDVRFPILTSADFLITSVPADNPKFKTISNGYTNNFGDVTLTFNDLGVGQWMILLVLEIENGTSALYCLTNPDNTFDIME